MSAIVKVIESMSPETESKRIGLRYINEFKCGNLRSISRIYSRRLSTITKQMAKEASQTRIIGVEEYNDDGYKLRFQYGIPNRFYPSVITVYDLMMDIDSYIESPSTVSEWEDIISSLNHAAYDKFLHEINEDYLKELR